MSNISDLVNKVVGQIQESGASPREVLAKVYLKFIPGLRLFEHRKPARAKHYMDFVRQQPCLVCGSTAVTDPHHHGQHAMGEKTDDYRCIPLCHRHHMEYHAKGFGGELSGWSEEDFLGESVRLLVLYLRGVEGT